MQKDSSTTVEDKVPQAAVPDGGGGVVPEIDLRAVRAALNNSSVEAHRRLYERLSILSMVDMANQFRESSPAHFEHVRETLAAFGVRV